MKHLFFFIIITALLFHALPATSHYLIYQSTYTDPFILHLADSVKQALLKQGFIVEKEASMVMESKTELPVIIPLTGGNCYQFVFIGDTASRIFVVRMFDWNEKQVACQKKQWGDAEANVISFSYTPQTSAFYMMKPEQVNNKKKTGLCGYVMLLKKIQQ